MHGTTRVHASSKHDAWPRPSPCIIFSEIMSLAMAGAPTGVASSLLELRLLSFAINLVVARARLTTVRAHGGYVGVGKCWVIVSKIAKAGLAI
jgi:hypothetical protein